MSKVKINLFINHFECGNVDRQKELDYCVNHNCESGYFNEIINFKGRLSYEDFFKETLNYPDDINILANTDIYFNETILNVRDIKENECYCITRWEEDGDNIVRFKDKHDYNKGAKEAWSQDVWVFKGRAKNVYGKFNLGVPGCDNRIAHEFIIAGYTVSNPCEHIQCIHRHKDPNRSYTISKRVPPPYKFIQPGDHLNRKSTRRRPL